MNIEFGANDSPVDGHLIAVAVYGQHAEGKLNNSPAGAGSYETCLQKLWEQTGRYRRAATIWLWRIVVREVIEDLLFGHRIELP